MSDELCLIAARRTPWGKFLGGLKDLSPADLAVGAGRAVLAEVPGAIPDLVIVGNVLAAGHGMNIARQVGVRLGLPVEVPAYTVNMMCGSGLQAIRLGAQALRAGEATTVLCGGTESMSGAAHLLPRSRGGWKLGDATLVDSLLCDGLVDAFDGRHMGLQAEDLARRFDIHRAAQDDWSARSQAFAGKALADGSLADEIVPTSSGSKSAQPITADEHPRPGTTSGDLAKLKPAFDPAGTVTAGNASGLNDGAALVLLTRLDPLCGIWRGGVVALWVSGSGSRSTKPSRRKHWPACRNWDSTPRGATRGGERSPSGIRSGPAARDWSCISRGASRGASVVTPRRPCVWEGGWGSRAVWKGCDEITLPHDAAPSPRSAPRNRAMS